MMGGTMTLRYVAAAVLTAAAGPALAACPLCNTTAGHKPSSIIPSDANTLNRFGDGFSNQVTNLSVQGNRATTVKLGFTANIGGVSFNTVNVSENGIVSFQASAVATRSLVASGGNPFKPVGSLKDFGSPVIAAFYADLQEGERSQREGPEVGQVFVQYGVADPTPDANGLYSIREALNATRITWYGLPVGTPADSANAALSRSASDGLAWAQILFTDMGNGDFNFELRSGNPDQDPPYSQDGLGSIAGFYLNGQLVEFNGPYSDKTPSYFAFRNGAYVTGGVPEPATWLLMISGFGGIGLLGRYKRRQTAITYA